VGTKLGLSRFDGEIWTQEIFRSATAPSGSDIRLAGPAGVFVDRENRLFVADQISHQIIRIDQAGNSDVVAGIGVPGYTGDGGPATQAELNTPENIFVDDDQRLFITDRSNHAVRMVNLQTGVISTVAGKGFSEALGDGGLATDARIREPSGITVDALGNIYISDAGNHRVRRVDAESGIIETVAGTGSDGFSGDGGPATEADLNFPWGLFLSEEGDLYIAEFGGNRVRKVDTSGRITTVAGKGPSGFGLSGFDGDGGPATQASLNSPSGVFLDQTGELYIVDWGNNRIRKVDPSGRITTVAGSGPIGFEEGSAAGDGGQATDAELSAPSGIFIDAFGNLFIADQLNDRVRVVDSAGIIRTFAGGGTQGKSPSNPVDHLLVAQDGALWLGTPNRGVYVFKEASGWNRHSKPEGLPALEILAMLETADGRIWVGTSEGTVFFDGVSWHEAGALQGVQAAAFAESADGTLWVVDSFSLLGQIRGEDESLGLLRFDRNGAQLEPLEAFTNDTGLPVPQDFLTSLYRDRQGGIWVGSGAFADLPQLGFGGGVARFDGQNWQHYGTEHGLASNNIQTMFQDFDGTMWFGTLDAGVSSFLRPSVPLANTEILSVPAGGVLGDSRFFFASIGREIGFDGLPPLSYAITPAGRVPLPNEWSRYVGEVTGFEVTGLTNGEWTYHVRAKDQFGNEEAEPAVFRFRVDVTAPTVVISSPHREDAVSGTVQILGSVFDASVPSDLRGFSLAYAREGSLEWHNILNRSLDGDEGFRTEDEFLGVWNTGEMQEPFGDYLLRLQAEDALGHKSEHQIEEEVVAALKDLKSREGGSVANADGTVSLMVPPNGLASDAAVHIVFHPAADLPPPPEGALETGIAYELEPDELIFNKRATLTLGYAGAGIQKAADLSIFEIDTESWRRLGGTVDEMAQKISVGIERAGTYALFDAPFVGGSARVSNVVCQPRIISPGGGVYPGVTDVSFELGMQAEVDVRVYGISGNLVKEVLKRGRLNGGFNTVHWNGRDKDEKVVRDGVYIVVIESGGKSARKTVGVLNR